MLFQLFFVAVTAVFNDHGLFVTAQGGNTIGVTKGSALHNR